MIFLYLEDYIEYMAGYRDATGKQINYWPDIKMALASYDTGFVTSVASQTLEQNIAMSHKQAALSEKLIEKYAKQLYKLGIEQPDHKNYRLNLREVKHITSLSIVNEMMYFRFPFNDKIIADIKSFCKESQGRVFWSKENKVWIIAITEYNVNWIVTYAQRHKIPIASEVQELYDLIIETEKVPYKIELCLDDNKKLYIANAPTSLNEYITKHIGFDNIYSLVDNSGVLSYTVSEEITNIMNAAHGLAFMKLCSDKNIDFVPKKDQNNSLSEIIEWAITVNRLPICVYNPNVFRPDLTIYQQYFKDNEIQVISMKDPIQNSTTVDPEKKIIYTNKILPDWNGRMPLLITYANLNHGITKQRFLTQAEKIVYYCQPLPNR